MFYWGEEMCGDGAGIEIDVNERWMMDLEVVSLVSSIHSFAIHSLIYIV